MPIFKIDAAALCIAHTFLDTKCGAFQCRKVYIEKSGKDAIRMTAMDGHKMISFHLCGANPSQEDFKPFGIRVDNAALKIIKPRKDKRFYLTLRVDDSAVGLEANGIPVSVEGALYTYDVSQIWERARTLLERENTFRPSVLPIKEFKHFDLSGFFGPCLFPSFVKAGQMTIVNFQGLPEGIAARGLIMQTSAGVDENKYAEIYGEDVPDWC